MKKTITRYGIYSAITISLLFIIALFAGKNLDFGTQEIIGYASMVVSLSFVFFGIKHYRDKENHGAVSFSKALVIGILISLFAALAFGIIDIIYNYLNPDFLTEYYDKTVEDMEANLPPAEFQEKLKEMEAQKALFSSPVMSFFIMSMTVFVIGFIMSLISALILQRKS